MTSTPYIGQRVQLRRNVERYPHFIAPEGARGMVVDMTDGNISVRMDDYLAGAEEWDNDVVWFEDLIAQFPDDTQPLDMNDEIVRVLTTHPTMPIEAANWHSGGGIFCVLVNVAPDGGKPKPTDPYMLATDRIEYDGKPGVIVGLYADWSESGEELPWPTDGEPVCYCDLSDVYDVVGRGAELLTSRDWIARGYEDRARQTFGDSVVDDVLRADGWSVER